MPALLAPGNYPFLANEIKCELVILTESVFFPSIREAEIFKRFEQYGRVRLVSIDDLLVGPGSYGLTLTLAFFRVLKELGAKMVDTWFLFLNADFILADDSYKALVPLIKENQADVICSPSYCAIEESALPLLERSRSNDKFVLPIPKRTMAEIILGNLHDTVRGQQIDGTCHFDHSYVYQGYVRPDPRIMLGYQMPIAIVALRPTQHVEAMTTFWDWGGVSELCPGGREIVLGDSDDFLMLELRERATAADLLRLGAPTPEHIAERLRKQLTKDQIHFGNFPLTLHACDLPADIERHREPLIAFFQRIVLLIGQGPVEHRNHPNWIAHFKFYNEKVASERMRVLDDHSRAHFVASSGKFPSTDLIAAYNQAVEEVLSDETSRIRKQIASEFSAFVQKSWFQNQINESDKLANFLDEYRALAFRHHSLWISHQHKVFYLPEILKSSEVELQRYERRLLRQYAQEVSSKAADPSRSRLDIDSIPQPEPLKTKRRSPSAILRAVAFKFLGRPPYLSVYHPYWAVFRNVTELLEKSLKPELKVLLVSDFTSSGIQRMIQEQSAKTLKVSVSNAAGYQLVSAERFDICFCELTPLQLREFRKIHQNILSVMSGNGKLLVFAINDAGADLECNSPEFVSGAFSMGTAGKILYSGSEMSVAALREYNRSTSSWHSPFRAAQAAVSWLRLAHKANLAEAAQPALSAPPRCCTSVTMEIDVPDFVINQHRVAMMQDANSNP